MEKIVVKTAVKTVIIIVVIFLLAFAVFNLAFPQHMATVTESMGNYSLAVKYADLKYTYSKNTGDLSRCFDDSVLLGDDALIIKYGDLLIADEHEFEAVCADKNEVFNGSTFDYKHRVYSKLAVSYYNTGIADKDEEKVGKAFALAMKDNGGKTFVYGNALMALAARISATGDAQAAKRMITLLESGNAESAFDHVKPTDETEKSYLSQVIANMRVAAIK